jgi:hypothetical protein
MASALEVLKPKPQATTRGGLNAAMIYEVALLDSKSRVGEPIFCMFNPYEYTVSKSNSFEEKKAAKGKKTPPAELSKSGPQTLKLNLLFDTYEQGADVSLVTNKLWKLMAVDQNKTKDKKDKPNAPLVAFEWGGVFRFVAFITDMTQKFTLFNQNGVPMRATVDITFTQYVDEEDYPNQNPTSGDGPINQVWRVRGGDRLDNIAAEVYGDPGKWSDIARANDLLDPLALRPGQYLKLPMS